MKSLWINATDRTVSEVEHAGLEDIQGRVGGTIEVACRWPNGDVLFVDEEGMLKRRRAGFFIPQRSDQPLFGNGLLVGREIGEEGGTAPPTMTVEELRRIVSFAAFL